MDSDTDTDTYTDSYTDTDTDDGYFKHFEHLPLYSDYNGKAYLMSDCSLRLKDFKTEFNILHHSTREGTPLEIHKTHSTKSFKEYVLAIGNILSSDICKSIIERVNKEISLQIVNYGQVRQNKRSIIFDQNFAEYLWNRLEDLLVSWFESNNINIMPLGFGVSKGSWEFCGINDAMRFNKYESKLGDTFEIHRDAQYCPSADKRSIMSLVIYLNDDFDGGETKFYLPKDVNIDTKGMNIQEEIEAHGGLQHGFEEITVKPKTGNAVLFSQSILHESLPLKSHKKFIIKTDVMVVRKLLLGFTLNNSEQEDFFECLNIFRTAQQNELEENNKVANELYEKCLSIRYSYPKALLKSRAGDDNNDELNHSGLQQNSMESYNLHSDKNLKAANPYTIFPYEIWCCLFEYFVSEDDVDSMVKVFPALEMFKKSFLEEKCLPKLNYSTGVFSKFSFDCSSLFVKTNLDGFSRLLCGYVLFLLGHKAFQYDVKCRHYIVNYDERDGKLSAIMLKTFLLNLFFKEKAYGTLYKVKQVSSEDKNIYYDFEQSVERSYMLMKHGREFCGIDIESEYQCKGEVFDFSCQSDDDSDTEAEESDVNQCTNDHNNDNGSDDSNINNFDVVDDVNCVENKVDDVVNDDKNVNYKSNHNGDVDDSGDNDVNVSDSIRLRHVKVKRKSEGTQYKCFEALPFKNENLKVLVEKYARLYENVTFSRVYSSGHEDEMVGREGLVCLPYESLAINEISKTTISYIRSVNKAILENVSGGGIVRFMNENHHRLYFMKSNKHCECSMKSDYGLLCYLDINFSKQPINHQIFDFSKQEMKVTRNIPKDDIMYSHLEDRVKKELEVSHNWEKMEIDKIDHFKNAFCVDISSLSQSDISFNHASCQCSFPRAFLEEYVNLESYAHVKNVYIIFEEVEPGKIFAWCCYGGIVAL